MSAKSYVYWNLHKGEWSVQERGLVVDRQPLVTLHNVEFRVRETGRQKVLRERRKNVHSFAVGRRTLNYAPTGLGVPVSYNPYKGGFFYDKRNGREIVSAARVILRPDRTVIAAYPIYGEGQINLENPSSSPSAGR